MPASLHKTKGSIACWESPLICTYISENGNFVTCMLLVVLDYFMQMGTSPWEWMPPVAAAEVMRQLESERGALAVFRRVSKGWRDAHDQRMVHLRFDASWFNTAQLSRFMSRFPRVKGIRIIGDVPPRHAIIPGSSGDEQWLRALTGLTAVTVLNLKKCERASDVVLLALAGFTSLTSLNLCCCSEVSDNGLRAIAILTALTDLNLQECGRVSDDGLRALAGLTSLTSLDLCCCDEAISVRQRVAGNSQSHCPHRPQLDRVWASVRRRVAGTGRPHLPHQPQLTGVLRCVRQRVARAGRPHCPH
jgi:hypothetical protein